MTRLSGHRRCGWIVLQLQEPNKILEERLMSNWLRRLALVVLVGTAAGCVSNGPSAQRPIGGMGDSRRTEQINAPGGLRSDN